MNEQLSFGVSWFSWQGLFSDQESRMVLYEYSIGTRPGYDDTHVLTQTSEECITIHTEQLSSLEEGHGYFLSIQVRGVFNVFEKLLLKSLLSISEVKFM